MILWSCKIHEKRSLLYNKLKLWYFSYKKVGCWKKLRFLLAIYLWILDLIDEQKDMSSNSCWINFKVKLGNKKYINLIIPWSSLLGIGLNKLSIISTFEPWVRTHALYLDISGHCLELTTYIFIHSHGENKKHLDNREI